MALTHDQITSRLEEIEQGFANAEQNGEQAAADYYKTKRRYEERYAEIYMRTEGQATERKQSTLLQLMGDQAYKDHVVAEAAYEGWRAAVRTLESRSMIGMALLKSSTREAPQGRQEPAWTPRAA